MLKKASKVGEILVCLKKPTGNTPPYPTKYKCVLKFKNIRLLTCKKLSNENNKSYIFI